MDSDFCSLPISLLRQHCFCPRIPFFVLVRELSPEQKLWVRQGQEYHELMQKLIMRRSFSHHGLQGKIKCLTNISLKGKNIALHGICDGLLVEDEKNYFPFEFKLSDRYSFSKGTQVQLTAYAMLCEERFNTEVRKAFVVVGKKLKPIPINIDHNSKKEVLRLLKEVHNNCNRAILPLSTASEKQCSQCEFLNFCADRL